MRLGLLVALALLGWMAVPQATGPGRLHWAPPRSWTQAPASARTPGRPGTIVWRCGGAPEVPTVARAADSLNSPKAPLHFQLDSDGLDFKLAHATSDPLGKWWHSLERDVANCGQEPESEPVDVRVGSTQTVSAKPIYALEAGPDTCGAELDFSVVPMPMQNMIDRDYGDDTPTAQTPPVETASAPPGPLWPAAVVRVQPWGAVEELQISGEETSRRALSAPPCFSVARAPLREALPQADQLADLRDDLDREPLARLAASVRAPNANYTEDPECVWADAAAHADQLAALRDDLDREPLACLAASVRAPDAHNSGDPACVWADAAADSDAASTASKTEPMAPSKSARRRARKARQRAREVASLQASPTTTPPDDARLMPVLLEGLPLLRQLPLLHLPVSGHPRVINYLGMIDALVGLELHSIRPNLRGDFVARIIPRIDMALHAGLEPHSMLGLVLDLMKWAKELHL